MDFQVYLVWLSEHGFDIAVSLLSVIFGLVIMIVQLKKFKINSDQVKESKLKYRTEHTKYISPTQSFKKVVPVYDLDERTNSLVVVGTKDLQELVQSSRDCGLDVVLEKFGTVPLPASPAVSGKSDEPYDCTDLREDLLVLADLQNDVELLRERYSMPDASPQELFKHISALKADTDKRIQKQLEKQVKEKSDEIS